MKQAIATTVRVARATRQLRQLAEHGPLGGRAESVHEFRHRCDGLLAQEGGDGAHRVAFWPHGVSIAPNRRTYDITDTQRSVQ